MLNADSELVKQARELFGDPKTADELFDEESAATRLAEESGLGMEALDAMAGEVLRAIPDKGVRGLLRRAAGAFMDWLAGGDVVPVVDKEGRVTELTGDTRLLGNKRGEVTRGRQLMAKLANALDDHAAEASEAWGKLQASRAAARQATLDALAREQVAKAQAAAEKAETAATEEERQDALREQQAAEAALDAALREQAEARDEQAARQLFALRGYLDEADRKNPDPKAVIPTLADSFAKLCRQPLPTKPAERNRALADRRAALKKWRDAKNRELDLLKLRAALGVDPAARLEYYVARENEAFRLEAREARKSIDDEKRRVKETPVAEGDALLANTRAVGHVEVESRESFVKRKMAENGWDRKTAIAQSTHLYPEDMQGLGVPPWASKQLYTGAGGHSPDTAAQALYDEGRIADPTVDAFWEAVRGDIETVSLSKQREIEAIEAEAAQAVERALALHRATLADIEQRDAEGGLPIPGDVRREVTAQGNAGADWTKWDNAEKLRRIRATRVIEIDTPTEGEVVGLLADYRVFAKGYRASIAKWATEGQVAPVNTNAYIGDIRTTKTSIKDIVSHGYGPLKVLVIPHLDEILQNAAPYSRGEDTKKGLRFINLAHRLTFEGEQLMAFITVQEDVNGNRTYDVEFGDEKRLSRELPIGAGAGETAHANPDSLDTTSVPQSGDNVNPRREVSGLFSGGPVPYDQPSLRAVGSNDGGKVYGWGLYADKVFDVARAFAEGPTAAIHEQRWWTHRAPGDESHLLDWELEVTPENRARVLAAVRSLDVTEEELRQIFGRDWATRGMTGEQAYELVVDAVRFFTEADESERAASELLVAFDIDGVHTRDDRSSTYVAFSDEHLQVVRRWVWDAATETFVPDASFLPPAPTSAEAQGRAQAVATVRREATGVLTPRTELALDDLLLRAVVAKEERRPQDAPFVAGSRIILPRYDLFFVPDHPNTNAMFFNLLEGYPEVSMEDIEVGARVLGLDVPLAFETLALQLQHYRDQILKYTTFGKRPDHIRGLYRGGPQYIHALPYLGDQTTEDFMASIHRIEKWRNDLLDAAWVYAELGPGVTIREGVRLPGIHLLKPEDRGWRWREHTLLTAFGKLRLDRGNQRRLTEQESKDLANDRFVAPETRTPREIVKTERYITKLIDFAKQHFGARIVYDCNRDGTDVDLSMTYPNGAEFAFHVEGSYALDKATDKLRHELLAALDGRSTARVPTPRDRLAKANSYTELADFARKALGVDVSYKTRVDGRALVLTGPDGAVETIEIPIKDAVGSRLAQRLRDALEKYLPPPTPDELRDWIATARALEPLEKIAADYLGTTVSYGEQEEESERVVITLTHADGSTTVLDTNWGVAIEELGRALANRLPQAAVAAPRREVTAAREARVDALVARLQAEKEQVREAYADDWMTAPNGAPTNLTEEQWLLVRTPSFKAWFGDWEHDPGHASKVVDENGEPLVVFHGSRTAGFTVFNKSLGELHSDAPDSTYWFAQFLADARTYSGSNDLIKLRFDSVQEAIDRYALFEEWHVVDEDGLSPRTGAEIFDDEAAAQRVADEINDDFEDRPYRAVKMWRNVEDNGWEGDAVFTTPEAALAYANDHIAETQHYPANYPVFLNLRNPMVRDFEGYNWDGLGEDEAHFGLWLNEELTFADDGDGNPIHFYDESEAADHAEELGLAEGDFEVQPLELPSTNDLARDALETGFYDGLIIRNVVDNGGEWGGNGPGTDYVVFDPRAIKSATENSGAFDPADPDIRREVGSATRLKDAHGDYPDLGDLIASPRFEVGSARAVVARALPNLPAEDADRFLAAYDALPDTKRKKAALHWFTRGGLDLPKDEDVFERALKAMDWWKLSFQNYDSPQALLLAANARLAKWRGDKTPDPIDPDTVPELTNKVDLGHGITVYEVQDDAQGQRAMWEIVKSHLGMREIPPEEDRDRGNRDTLDPKHWAFWSPWCLLVPTQSGDRPSRSAEEYWDYYCACPKRAAFKDGRVISFCASEDNAMGEWWDMEDKSHDERIPVTVQVEAAEFGLVDEHADDVSGTVDLETELTIYGELPTGEDLEVAGSVFSRGNKEDGTYEEWFAGGLLRVRETRVDGELEGERVVYDERDNRFIVEHYKGGKLDGVRERRVPGSWELRARSTYKDGHHVGVSEVWHRDGSLAKRYPYDENGERHGDVEEFARNGTRTTLKQYVHGKANGVFAYWTEGGQLRSVTHWRDSKEDGESLEYRDGTVVTREEFREGVEIVPSWARGEMFGTPFTSEQVTVRDRPYNRLSRFSLYRSEDGTVSRVDFSSVLSGERVEAEFAPDGTLRRRDIQKGDTYVSERYARNGRLVSYTAHRGSDDQVEVNAEGEFYATLRKTFNEDPERIDEAVFARLRADYEAELGDLAVTAASAPGLLLDAVNENRARFGLESLPADYSPAPRREVTAAGPHANEPFTYAKSALRKRVDRAQMEGEGTNPIGKRDIVELTDIPPFWLDYGFQNGRLFTIADILRKIKKEHHIDASAFAELPEHYSRPVAILIQNEEWTILTDQLADDGTGRLAPVMLYVRQAKDGTNAYLASAYSRDVAGESAYINKANAGGLLYLDDIRIDALPLAGETKKALLEKWHSGKRTGAPFGPQEELNRSIQTSGESAFTSDNQGNANTIAQPRANVNPQAAFDEARRRLEVAGLYYGRAPEAAELSDRAIAEFAVAEEALRTGKKPSQAQVSQAFADFGLHPGEQSGRSARRTLKLLNDLGLTYDKDGNAVAVPKGALSGLLSRNERLRGAFDSAWSEAEAEAFSKGAASAFAAARGMAAETQALAKAHRDEAEAVLGMDPGILQAELGFDIEATLLADKTKWQKLTPQQAEALAKKRAEERRKALEEAEAAAQALQDGLPPREPSLAELGLDEAGVAKLRAIRDELRKRLAELDREAEARRRERELRFRERQAEEKEGKTEDQKEQEDADALLARKLELLKGVAFDIDDPVSVREFVNLVILHVAERRAGSTFAAPVQLNRQLTDPLTVRDAARTLAQILSEMADRLAYGDARERVKQAAMRLTMAETIGQTRALAVGAFASLRNAMVRESQTEMRDQMVKAIDAVTQSGAFAVGREDSERRVTGDLERRLRAIKQALTLGALGRARLREEAMAKLSGLQADRSLDADTLCSMRDYLDAQRVIVSLNEYGGWRQMGLGELADLRDKLLRLVQTGMDEHERRIQQFEARVARITEPILAALKQNPPETKPGRHSKKAERLAAWLDEHLGLQNLLFETLLSRATGEVRAKGARAVRELLAAFTEASVIYESRKQAWQREAQDIIARAYGSVTAWQARMRETIDDDHRKRISNRRTERQEQAGVGPAQKTALTRGQVLQLYASVIQSDYALNARLHRRDGDCLEAMRECLDARDLQFLAEMSAFFRKIFPDLRDAYKAVTGVTVGTTPGYWPVRINYEREGLPARVRAWSPIVAAMEPRRRNSLDFREDVSVEEMVWGRIDDWAHMMGYGQMGILARAVLGDRHLREAIRNSLGDKLAKRIQDNVLDALLGPETDPGAGFLLIGARYTSGMSMALNVGVMLKQFAGIPAFAHAVGGRKTLRFWWAGVAKDAAFDRDWAILTRSPSFKARYGAGLNAEMKAALAGGEPGGFTGRASRFYSWGLQWQTWADKIVCRPFAVGAFREYRDAYLREGMTEDEAVRRAVIDAWAMIEATQQSSRPENQLRSVNKNRFFRYLAQFRSAPLQSLQWELRAFSAMLRGEEGARARFIKAVIVNHVFAPLFYVALDALWNEVILLGLWEDDDEEKERRYKRYCAELALQFLFGQLPAIPLYGNALEVFYSWIVKNAERKEEGRDLADLTGRELAQEMVDIPVVRTEANLVAAAASLAKDAVTLDWRSAASEIDDFAKTALAPVRDLQKAAKRGLGHDLDDLWEEDPAEKRRRVRRQMAEAARRRAEEEEE